ncbi:SH3 domain-binding protein 5 homolog [Calliphora vicina]|uniref:SH3 domain-binding protein 5 homolog n=1 Tax=Calliphora vicina TaxID=7373 RepID=UPI00325AD469
MSAEDSELDPRIKIELENLNTATDEINKLEIELEEANSTFRILMNESTRRLKLSSKKLGSCIDKARPYYEALEKAREAQIECQKAAVKFQRANEIHAAAKETVALAEQRFMSNSHEWQFDNAWQEMLNHATQKVMDAEKQKADCHAEHQRRTRIFHAAEQKVQQLEERFRRSITKSRPYFEEKQICQDQLQTQKNRIEELQVQVQTAKSTYATALRNLERISDDIHRQRGDYPQLLNTPPPGPREPGVGAELNSPTSTTMPSLPDYHMELDKCDYPSIAGSQISLSGQSEKSSETACSSKNLTQTTSNNLNKNAAPLAILASKADTEIDEEDDVVIKQHYGSHDAEDYPDEQVDDYNDSSELNSGLVDEKDLEALRQQVKFLAVRPIEGGDGQQEQNDVWEHELNATVDKLDHLMLLKECAKQQQQQQTQQHSTKIKNISARPDSLGAEACPPKNPIIKVTQDVDVVNSLPTTPEHVVKPLKKLQKLEPLPLVNVSMRELPLLARLSNEVLDTSSGYNRQRRRSLD